MDKPNFETMLQELEQIVQKMETGQLSLEEALAQFEQGIHLSRNCQLALDTAEQKVAILLNARGPEPFNKNELSSDLS